MAENSLKESEREALIQWYLGSCENPDTKFMTHGDNKLSATDIANEIRAGTEFGREQMEVLLIMRGSRERGMSDDEFVQQILDTQQCLGRGSADDREV